MPILTAPPTSPRKHTSWRRDLHENPEILYEVHRTAAQIVAEKLKAFGCDEVVPGIADRPASWA